MDLQLTSKRVFITGSTRGIGYATAQLLIEEGAEVVLHGRTEDSVNEAVNRLKETTKSQKISGLAADLSKKGAVNKLIPKLGFVDILINNAGTFTIKDFMDLTEDDWETVFEVNLMNGVWLSKALLPAMLKQNWGRIIFISSESGFNIPVEMIHYGVSKTAVLGLSRGLAKLTTGTNVTVNSVLPGPTHTEAFDKIMKPGEDLNDFAPKFFKEARPTSILKRFTEPREIANLIAYLASPLSSGTNGASLRVDGGAVDFI